METIRDMAVIFLSVFRFVRLLLGGHQAIAIENAALRMQLAAFQRKRKRPLLTTVDRVFWIALRSLWSDWRHPLIYVQADTVVRWHRERFRRYRAGYRRWTRSGELEFLILPETFKTQVCAQYDYRVVAHALKDRGFLICNEPHLTIHTLIPEIGKARVFCISGTILK